MSLDVSLILKNKKIKKTSSGIFIRENGSTKEITTEEWNKKNPDKAIENKDVEYKTSEVFDWNITHNLNEMAEKAGLYKPLWRPYMLLENYKKFEDYNEEYQFEEENKMLAECIIKPLEEGLKKLKDNPIYFKKFNPENGWGKYENLVEFSERYLEACKKYPKAEIEISR
jgi:hypothetical protein